MHMPGIITTGIKSIMDTATRSTTTTMDIIITSTTGITVIMCTAILFTGREGVVITIMNHTSIGTMAGIMIRNHTGIGMATEGRYPE